MYFNWEEFSLQLRAQLFTLWKADLRQDINWGFEFRIEKLFNKMLNEETLLLISKYNAEVNDWAYME